MTRDNGLRSKIYERAIEAGFVSPNKDVVWGLWFQFQEQGLVDGPTMERTQPHVDLQHLVASAVHFDIDQVIWELGAQTG